MSSFAFMVTSIFSDSGRGEVDVLRGYIAHRLISLGIQFLLVMQVCLEFSSVCRRPAKKRPQSLAWIEFEDPAFRLLADIKTTKARQSHAFTCFEALIQCFDDAVDPGCRRRFIGLHPCSKSADKLIFVDTLSHLISPYNPAVVSSSFKVESRLCRLRNQARSLWFFNVFISVPFKRNPDMMVLVRSVSQDYLAGVLRASECL